MAKATDISSRDEKDAPEAARKARSTFNSDETRRLIAAFALACELLEREGVAFNRLDLARAVLQLARLSPIDERELAGNAARLFLSAD